MECPVCLEPLSSQRRVLSGSSCSHHICLPCLEDMKWTEKNNKKVKCPNCNALTTWKRDHQFETLLDWCQPPPDKKRRLEDKESRPVTDEEKGVCSKCHKILILPSRGKCQHLVCGPCLLVLDVHELGKRTCPVCFESIVFQADTDMAGAIQAVFPQKVTQRLAEDEWRASKDGVSAKAIDVCHLKDLMMRFAVTKHMSMKDVILLRRLIELVEAKVRNYDQAADVGVNKWECFSLPKNARYNQSPGELILVFEDTSEFHTWVE